MNEKFERTRFRSLTRPTTRAACASLGLLAAMACGTDTEEGSRVALGPAQAALEQEFAVIQTVRELPDGRVLLADPLGQALVVLDMEAGTADTIGRVGEGPEEYRQPDAVWPLPDGGSLLVDLGNGRLTEMGADLSFGDTRPYMLGSFELGSPIMLAIPQGVDDRGGIFFQGFGMSAGGNVSDSAEVLRYDLGTEAVDTVVNVKLTDRTRRASGGPNNQNVSISPVPLSSADSWGVAGDGRVVVARSVAGSGEFRVEWFGPDGEVTRGPAYPYSPVGIGRAEMEEWRDSRAETGGGMTIQVEATNGVMNMRAERGGPSGQQRTGQLRVAGQQTRVLPGTHPGRSHGTRLGAPPHSGGRCAGLRSIRRVRLARSDGRAASGAASGGVWRRGSVRGKDGRVRLAVPGEVRVAVERRHPATRGQGMGPTAASLQVSASVPGAAVGRRRSPSPAEGRSCRQVTGLPRGAPPVAPSLSPRQTPPF